MRYALGGVFAAVLMLGSVGDAEAATLNFFQPVDNTGRVGYLALNNVTTTASNVTLTARDDAGTAAPGGTITLTLASRQSIYLSSSDLESGRTAAMKGAFGNGSGSWHIDITATGGNVSAQNFLYTPDGSLSEHTAGMTAESDGSYLVKFFTEPGKSIFNTILRLRNLTSTAGTVTVTAKNSAGADVSGSATVTLSAYKAVEVASSDLSKGNAAVSTTGNLGASDGFWILKLVPSNSIFAAPLALSPGGNLVGLGSNLAITASAATSVSTGCPTSNFLTVTQNSKNTAYAAPSLSVTCSSTTATVTSNSIPNFEFVQTTPNRLQTVSATYRLPVNPTPATGTLTTAPLVGAAAVTVGGLAIYGPTEARAGGSRDPVKDNLLDYCGGHTDQRGQYHNHYRPDCLFATIVNKTALVMGYAFDGYPILAPYECTDASCTTVYKVKSSYKYIGGATAAWSSNVYVAGSGNLDKCNGMTRPDGSYAYYATDEFPYFLACYHGTPDTSNFNPNTTFATIVTQ